MTQRPIRLKILSYPGLFQTGLLFIVSLLWFASGLLYAYIPPWLSFLKASSKEVCFIGGGAGMLACLILFLISFAVSSLK